MSSTPNMGLTKWDLTTDFYDHSQLSTNFSKLDSHDHSTGNGVQIKRSGIASYDAGFPTTTGIHNDQLAPDAVTTDKILDGTIQAGDIANSVFDRVSPLGEVIAWYRSDPSIPIPTSWAVCDGSPWSGITNKMGVAGAPLTAGNILDLRNKFILGAATSGTGTTTATPPAIGAVNGSHTANLSHSHTANAHSHNVNAHTHGTNSHYHTVNSHTHFLQEHRHMHIHPLATFGATNVENVNWAIIHPQDGFMATDESSRDGVGYDPGFSVGAFYDVWPSTTTIYGTLASDAGGINQMTSIASSVNRWAMISGAPVSSFGTTISDTGAAAPNTNSAAPDTLAATSTTDSQTVTMSNSLSSTTDIRPGHVGLLYIMKVTY